MGVRLIHTADWQIGKVFRFLDNAAMGLLQEARLQAVTRLGELAMAQGAGRVLVAGDVYDMEALSPRSLNQPLERMRAFPAVEWHLLPGNHDPHRPNGLWDQLLRRGLPANVRAHLAAEPQPLGEEAVLLPAPLRHRRGLGDPTAWMEAVALPEELLRIGLAHGTVTGFGSEDREVPNLIAPDRPARAGLDYLALGDWHGQCRIGERCWYAGTPETDAFDVVGGGRALLVSLEGRGAPPQVTPLETGHFTWLSLAARLAERADVDHLVEGLQAEAEAPERSLVQLAVEGTLSLEERAYFEEQVVEGVSAAFCFLRLDDSRLFGRPSAEDLDQIDRGGFVRQAAETLKRQAEQGGAAERELAAEALQRLYLEHRKLQAGLR